MTTTSIAIRLGIAQTIGWASSYYLPAILADPIAAATGTSATFVFGCFSGALLLSAILAPTVGRMVDQRGGRELLIWSNLILALGLSALAAAQGPISLALAWGVIGAGMATGLYDVAFSLLARDLGQRARGAIAGVALIAGFASTIGWPFSEWLQDHFGWRIACLAWAILHLGLALPLNLSLQRSAAEGPTHATARSGTKASTPPAVPAWILGLLAYVFAANWFVSTAMAAHLPRLLVGAGLAMPAAVAAAALVGPAQVAARLAEFALLRRTSPLTAAIAACLLHPVGAFAFVVLGAPAAVLAIAHGAGNGILTIATGTLPLILFGSQGYGRRQGVLAVPARLAQAAAPFVFGALLDQWKAGALLATSLMLLLAAVSLVTIMRAHRES